MRKIVVPTLAFLILAVWVQAQSASQSPVNGQAPANVPDGTTLTGCLQTSTGHYTLTEEDGTTHELSGGAKQLRHHVGHEVEITGKPGTRTVDVTQAGAASSVVEKPVFEVKSVKHIADKCTSR